MELILFRLQNNLHTITGKPLKEGEDQVPTYLPESMQLPVDEYDKLYGDKEFSNIELAELNLKELHEKYNSAPEDEELGPPRYQIELKNSTLPQSNILCKKGDIRYSLNFINPEHGETGAALWVDRLTNYHEIGGELEDTLPDQPTPLSELKDPAELEKIRALLKNTTGIDYMELYEFYQTDNACEYIFTRSYHGAVEDYVGCLLYTSRCV